MPDYTLQTDIQVDGSPLDPAVESLVEQVVVDDYLHAPDMFVLVFRDVERTVLTDARMRIGSRVRIEATAVGGGAAEALITGEVTAIEGEYGESGSRLLVRGYDPSHRLHRGRRTRTFVQEKLSDIARQIATEAGLEVGIVDDSGAVLPHVSQANATDWEFLTSLAGEIGFELAVEQGLFDFRRPSASSDAPDEGDFDSDDPLQLVFGQELIDFQPRITSAGQVREVVVRGWDPDNKRPVIGRAPAAASSAELATGPAELAAVFGDPVHVCVDRPLSTQAAVDATARALADQIGSVFAEAVGVARGNPRLRSGTAISVGVVADAFAGKYVITQARHSFDQDGYRTQFIVSGRQDRSLLRLASVGNGNGTATGGSGGRIDGVVVGLVTNNEDPDGRGRVKLKFPWLAEDYESDWTRVASPGAGPDAGVTFLPEVNDEVLVAFEFGDVRRPYVIGGLWNGVDRPLLGDGLFDRGRVRRSGLVSRRGHRLVLLDGDDRSGIALVSAGDGLRIALKASDTEIHVASDGTIVIESQGDLTIRSSADVSVEASARLTLKGSAGVTIESGGTVDIDGALVTLN